MLTEQQFLARCARLGISLGSVLWVDRNEMNMKKRVAGVQVIPSKLSIPELKALGFLEAAEKMEN